MNVASDLHQETHPPESAADEQGDHIAVPVGGDFPDHFRVRSPLAAAERDGVAGAKQVIEPEFGLPLQAFPLVICTTELRRDRLRGRDR